VKKTVGGLVALGYQVKLICEALGVSRSGYYRNGCPGKSRVTFDPELLDRITRLCCAHPFWGYRRITAWLKYRENLRVNHKRVYGLMRRHNLTVPRKLYLAKRKPDTKKPVPTCPNQWWGIDMTKFMVENLGYVYLTVVEDWYTRKILGYHLGTRSKSSDWLAALEQAVGCACPEGSRNCQIQLMSDNGSQPTSVAFMKTCSVLGIKQAFTAYNNPKGNANTERLLRTIKEELIWVNEFKSLEEVEPKLKDWVEEYNQNYLHSALGYKSPEEFEKQNRIEKVA
jgi:transposase InsO family protein